MQFDASRPTPSSSSHSHLKRSFAQQATAQRTEDHPSTQDTLHAPSTRENHRPGKVPKIQRSQSPSSFHAAPSTSSTFPPPFEMPTSTPRSQAVRGGSRSLRTGTWSAPGSRSSSKTKGKKPAKTPLSRRLFDGPLYDQDYIVKNYKKDLPGLSPLKETHEDNPKSPVSNFIAQVSGGLPEFSIEQGFVGAGKDRKEVYRYAFPPTFFLLLGIF